MTDEIEAVTEAAKAIQEAAKTTGKAIDLTSDLGKYLGKVVGGVPSDLVGLLGGDYLGQLRIRNLDKSIRKTKKIIEDRKAETEPVSLALAVPILKATENESREELQDLWARLLANAMDKKRSATVRLEFIQIIQQLNPLDAMILDHLNKIDRSAVTNTRDVLMALYQLPESRVVVSLQHLTNLSLIHRADQGGGVPQRFVISYLGSELCQACKE
jgi:Abortive infection alpha